MRSIKPYIHFRARRVDDGQWVVGNYIKLYRKSSAEYILEHDTNEEIVVIRDTLQIRLVHPNDYDVETGENKIIGDWENI